MTWRRLVRACLGVLLPLPLVLLSWGLLKPEALTETPGGKRISPMLAFEQRERLTTYRHECSSPAECEPPLTCLYESRYRQSYCTDSQCMTDTQCPEGHLCRPLATKEKGLQVRICVPLGVRQEGESCAPSPQDQDHACAAGLVCGGQDTYWCGRPCRLEAGPEACPAGFFCADTEPEPVCQPTCEGRACPEGQQCIRFEQGTSVCATAYGPQCQQSPCPEGRLCRVLTYPPQVGKAWLECIERCGEGPAPCSPGKVCDAWQCLPACDPRGPAVCAEGFRCQQPWPDSAWACHPAR
jgi:hypothetical protein